MSLKLWTDSARKRPLIVAFPTDQEFRAHLKNVLVELKNKSKA